MKEKPVKFGQKYMVEISGLSHLGEGIGKVNNFAVFVPGTIPQEKVEVVITEVKKNFARGNLIKVHSPSAKRVEPPCAFADKCGGCQLQHIDYALQLQLKQRQVEDALIKLGGIKTQVQPVLGMDYPWRYRNKGHFQLEKNQGQIALGFYEPGTHDFVPAKDSLLFSTVINKLVRYLEETLTIEDIKLYDRERGQEGIRNIMVRESKATGELMVIFITSTEDWQLASTADSLTAVFPQVVSIYQNVNKTQQSVILGDKFIIRKGQEFIMDNIGELKFKISPQSFFQINNCQTEVLYNKAIEFAGLSGEETVLDAYCGIGSIALFIASQAKHVIGIEVVKEAIDDARKNAELNTITNAEFIVGKVEEWLPRWVSAGGKADVIIVDPPRKGCAPETLEAIAEVKPRRVVYVSCNPGTLARDLKYLTEHGYETKEVQPVDMFPQTGHVESIIMMTNSGSKGK
ncbi:MAG: 23S rRNA (uracil(1939)-C(5))-methyltransferase RlmD [Bacillota bacterium]